MDVANFHGVGGDNLEFRRSFSTSSGTKMRLWLNFYFCDAAVPRPGINGGIVKFTMSMRVFVLRGISLNFADIFGRIFHTMTIYKSLKYVVNHHQDEKSLVQEKVQWDRKTGHLDEFLSLVTLTYSQNLDGVRPGDERPTMVKVTVAGSEMPDYQFMSTQSLEIIQTLFVDCISLIYDCAEVTQVVFSDLTRRTRQQDVAYQLQFLPAYKAKIEEAARLVRERTGETTAMVPPSKRGTPGKLRVLVGIMTVPGRFEFRLAQRRSWMTHPLVRNGDVVFKYFISSSPSALMNEVMEEEARVFGDVILLPETDVYLTIGYKIGAIITYFAGPEWEHDGPLLIGKSDDDVFKNLDVLFPQLQVAYDDSSIYGPIETHQTPKEWYWTTSDNREYSSGMPKYMAGPFYVISAPVVRDWVRMEAEHTFFMFHQLEDRQTGLWIEQYRRRTGKNVTFRMVNGLVEKCAADIAVLHHVVPDDMDCLYKRSTEAGRFTCCDKKGGVWH